MNANQAIENLLAISAALDKCAQKTENYNSEWGVYLEHMSFEMYKQANELNELAYIFDLPQSLTI